MRLIENKISAPASKSYLQRALVLSALSQGTSVLRGVSWCNDTLYVRKLLENLGVDIQQQGTDLTIRSEGLSFESGVYNVGESGLAIRMLAPILALRGQTFTLKGEGSLMQRPMQMVAEALEQLGLKVDTNNGRLPITVSGQLKAGNIHIDGSVSSQLLTGLLMALPLAEGDSLIRVSRLKSKPYIDMTLDLMRQFKVEVKHNHYEQFYIKGQQSYCPTNHNIEGDWSGSAFFLIYGAIKAPLQLNNLSIDTFQADKKILEVLEKAGAKIDLKPNAITVYPSNLQAFNFDATDSPDLFPPLACLASQCEGLTQIKGVSRLIHKESNRAEALQNIFSEMGISIEVQGDTMLIKGVKKPSPCTIDSYNDHRIAMSGALMNCFCNGSINILNKEAVNKSYPDFFEQICAL